MNTLVFPLSKKEAEKAGLPYSSENNRNATFPTRLRKTRNSLGLSQEQLAKKIHVTKSTISLYETGDNVPDIKTFSKICDLFGVSYDYLLGKDETPQKEHQDLIDQTHFKESAATHLNMLIKPGICDAHRLEWAGLEALLSSENGLPFLKNLAVYLLGEKTVLRDPQNETFGIKNTDFYSSFEIDTFIKDTMAPAFITGEDLNELFFVKLQRNLIELKQEAEKNGEHNNQD